MPGNIDCKNCGIKALLKKDGWGTYHLSEAEAKKEGLIIVATSSNSWISLPSQKIVRCARGENGITAIIDEQ